MSGPSPHSPYLGSTYRLQLNGLGFTGATEIVPYLHELGIETLYCSPILQSVSGSTHGYDVADPTQLDPALGGQVAFENLLAALATHGMRLLIDIVPNHLAAHPENPWWWDVLRRGRQSAYAPVFDINWDAQNGKVLLPTLSRPLSEVLFTEGGAEIVTELGHAQLSLDGQRFPVIPVRLPDAGPLSIEEALALLAEQHYRLAYWRLAGDEVNYRRFFDISGLVGVRVEDPAVFDATHGLLESIGRDERVAGFRVDHVDGLALPGAYLETLRRAVGHRQTAAAIVVEKILATDETLPEDWSVDGTTGYEFADAAGALFIAPEKGAVVFADQAEEAKREILAESFGSSSIRLADLATRALDLVMPGHDLSSSSLHQAISALTVHLDVYRTYLEGESTPPRSGDRVRISDAVGRAVPTLSQEPARALRSVAEGLIEGGPPWTDFSLRWQQLTGAVMAKGVEDTASYRANGFLGHADVGSSPERPGLTPAGFTAIVGSRASTHPLSLNTTSTHDSKRSEDVRARLYALTEWTDEWWAQVAAWRELHAPQIRRIGGPESHAVQFCYQTMVAAWPPDGRALEEDEVRRIENYMVKAAREAKLESRWDSPSESYETALMDFVRHLASSPTFRDDAAAWIGRIGPAAATISLAMVILKAICPGTLDVYQGNEVWEYALTDPDNRRPVDFDHLSASLQCLVAGIRESAATDDPAIKAEALLRHWPDGRLKLHVLHSLLVQRRDNPLLFANGSFFLLDVNGPQSEHVIALGRRHQDQWIIALMPRLMRPLRLEGEFALGQGSWSGTSFNFPDDAPRRWTDILTGQVHTAESGAPFGLATALTVLPVAVLAAG